MGRPQSPCGTPAAYRRHLRSGEDPCPACRAAHTAEAAQGRRKGGKPTKEPAREPMTEGSTREQDLMRLRDVLVAAIDNPEDQGKLAGLARELRATWKDLEALTPDEGAEVAEDEFTAARRRRTEGAAGA